MFKPIPSIIKESDKRDMVTYDDYRRLEKAYNHINKKLEWMREYELSLNRRAKVEGYLFEAARGFKSLPDKNKCRELAINLGVPDSWLKSNIKI